MPRYDLVRARSDRRTRSLSGIEGRSEMSGKGKSTSPRVAKVAAKALRSDRTTKTTKTVAGSALSQKESKGKK